ncbi:MAG: tripartite tricarboxylate transporter TctB family protein [Pseudomonadota bacterium]
MLRIRLTQDLLSGLFFCAVAIAGLVLSSRLGIGTPSRMGAGFFPIGLSIVLLVLGGIVLLRSFLQPDEPIGEINLRPLTAVLLSVVVFSLLVERWGFALAGVLLIVIGRLAADRFKAIEVTVLSVGLVGASALVFLYALKLPLHFLPF